MLCLKAEALDDDDHHHHNGSPRHFVLPISLGRSSIHRYLWKTDKGLGQSSLSSGDGSLSSADLEDTNKVPEERSGQERDGKTYLYKNQLELDVKKLQQQLQEEIDLRLALATAVARSDSSSINSPSQLPNKAQELLESIAVLEIAVSKLEKELVALQCHLSQERNERRLTEYRLRHLPSPRPSLSSCPLTSSTHLIMRQRSREKAEEKTGDVLPWPDVIEEQNKDHFLESLWHPNKLSEEMVSSMRDIYLSLADPSKHPSSESRSSSDDMNHCSEVLARERAFDPYRVPGKVDWSGGIGAYNVAVEVSWLSVGKKELEYAAVALQRFRLLVEQLARVNPSTMRANEKLAFWINLYNTLIMHAYLAYGVPSDDMKLFSLMQKASYNVGGHSITAADMEYSILKMKPLSYRPQIKFKFSEEQKMYSIDNPEPLLAFALSCGMHSSPAVRVFKPENVNELLKRSLRDYIRASVGISSKGKLLVPKLLHSFAKGSVEDSILLEWICQHFSREQAAMVRNRLSNHRWRLLGARTFSVVPFDSRFRFLFLLDERSSSSSSLKA